MTVEKPSCATTQGAFGSGPCPTAGLGATKDGNTVVDPCSMRPSSPSKRKAACDEQYEATFAP
jgi:hypothetical protein